MVTTPDMLWLVIVSGVACFFMAFVTGANDIANTFSTSIGSKAITLGKAIAVAFFFEALGASLLGGTVTDSIRTKIINFNAFEDAPEFLMLGMCCALIGATLWLTIATYAGIPVSTTHSIVGALAGFGLATGKIHAIKWNKIYGILLSWCLAPILSGTCSAATFALLRFTILRRKNSVKIIKRTYWFLILLITLPFSVFLVFHNPIVINKECEMLRDGQIVIARPCYIQEWCAAHTNYSVLICIMISLFLTAVTSTVVYLIYCKRIENYHLKKGPYEDEMLDLEKNTEHECYNSKNSSLNSVDSSETQGTHVATITAVSNKLMEENKEDNDEAYGKGIFNLKNIKYKTYLLKGDNVKQQLNGSDDNGANNKLGLELNSKHHNKKDHSSDDGISDIHIEKFDPETEIIFSSLQIISAILGVIAQSANDTANAIGPFAAVFNTFHNGLKGKIKVQWYILLFGGLSMSLGLATLGYKVIRTVGMKLIKITPSRGFTVELVAGLVVLFFSICGIPLSSTHCAVSSVVGVGLVEARLAINKKKNLTKNLDANALGGNMEANFLPSVKKSCYFSCINTSCVNLKLFQKVFLSWIVTVLFSAGVTAAIFSFAAYSPSYRS